MDRLLEDDLSILSGDMKRQVYEIVLEWEEYIVLLKLELLYNLIKYVIVPKIEEIKVMIDLVHSRTELNPKSVIVLFSFIEMLDINIEFEHQGGKALKKW